MAKTTALAVANFIIAKGREEGIPIRHLKLQKLVYFCFAWYAGNKGEPLFDEDIEAWQYGPVVRDLYVEFMDCGANPISGVRSRTDPTTGDVVVPTVTTDPELTDDLLSVWNAYKLRSDAWLVDATHQSDEPWEIIARQRGTAGKPPIPFSLIEKKYAEKVAGIGD